MLLRWNYTLIITHMGNIYDHVSIKKIFFPQKSRFNVLRRYGYFFSTIITHWYIFLAFNN